MLYGDISARQGPTTIDSFEDQDLAEYTGNTGNYTVTTAAALDGSYAIQNSTDAYEQIQSTSGLPVYPSPGNTVRVGFYFDGSTPAYAAFTFYVQDSNNFYFVRPRGGNNDYEICQLQSGSTTVLQADTSVSFSANTWYEAEIRLASGGGFDSEIYDSTGTAISSTLSTTDSTWTSGGIGWGSNTNTAIMDYARIL